MNNLLLIDIQVLHVVLGSDLLDGVERVRQPHLTIVVESINDMLLQLIVEVLLLVADDEIIDMFAGFIDSLNLQQKFQEYLDREYPLPPEEAEEDCNYMAEDDTE